MARYPNDSIMFGDAQTLANQQLCYVKDFEVVKEKLLKHRANGKV